MQDHLTVLELIFSEVTICLVLEHQSPKHLLICLLTRLSILNFNSGRWILGMVRKLLLLLMEQLFGNKLWYGIKVLLIVFVVLISQLGEKAGMMFM